MTYTANYSLKKPETNDYVSPAAFNENADVIDAKLKEHDDHAAAKDNPHEVTAAQVGARPDTWTPTAGEVGAVPVTRKVNNKALSADITLTASDVGARADTWVPTAPQVCNGITFYKNLAQISSSLTTNSTPYDVANAMADASMLIMATSGSGTYTGGLIPQPEHGILTIVKDSIARVSFEFIGENTGFYDSFMRSISSNFKGWRRHYTTANTPSVVTSYTGTGVSGSSNPNTLTFNFVPKFMMIQGANTTENGIYIGGSSMLMYSDNGYDKQSVTNNHVSVSTSPGSTTISWYYDIVENTPAKQLNKSGTIYYCVAFA